ncbi:PR-1 protein-like protein [Dinothrombium tinctorium]|uniref:PR-1 protein-like protein n=1 Tax=Dinothrombium tinctorium TaxID=1965070 RepID=A0A443R173_9ACAR|nr:PR-1 protein-like protein [Dinothrombium tinctorium]RWS09003.1 PR-1 protein-like protein [Dinothrombium tinctorium]
MAFGENLAGGNLTCTEAVDRWYKQKRKFDPKEPKSAGPYTQIIWKSTRYLGCAKTTHCLYKRLIICFYYPPGNIVEEYPTNKT